MLENIILRKFLCCAFLAYDAIAAIGMVDQFDVAQT